jgi:hypothetical protein
VMENLDLAERMGHAGLDQVSRLTWPAALGHLLTV